MSHGHSSTNKQYKISSFNLIDKITLTYVDSKYVLSIYSFYLPLRAAQNALARRMRRAGCNFAHSCIGWQWSNFIESFDCLAKLC